MRPVALSQVAAWCEGRHLGADPAITAVSTDTRQLAPGALFVALRGENFDAHDFVAEAEARGASALLLHRDVPTSLPKVLCADTQEALGEFAAGVQRGRPAVVVALTGSNGKTSVKTLVHGILARAGRAYVNPGNRNNEIGLPLAVIDAPETARYAIYEMGAGKPGDIAYLCAVVRPDVSLVNNVAPAHLERMGSLLGIADTKAAILDALPADGVAAVNVDDAFAPYFAERAQGHRIIRFGLDGVADVTATDIVLEADGSRFTLVTPEGRAAVTLALPGRHNVLNALAAASLAIGAGIGLPVIAAGLSAARPVAGRLNTHRLPGGALLIDDSYNANPGSLNAAIDTLAALGGERWLVLGDMRELGDDAVALHAQTGRRAKASGITRLFALGELAAAAAEAFGEGGQAFGDHAAVANALCAGLAGGAAPTVLVKGSRGSAMDTIVKHVLAAMPAGRGEGDAA